MIYISISRRNIFNNDKNVTLNTTYTNIGGVGLMMNELKFGDNRFQNDINSIDDEIYNHEIQSRNKIQNLKEAHNRRMQRMNSQYFDIKNILQNYSFNEEESQIEEKKKEIDELERMGDDINTKSFISQSFMENQKKIFNDKFNEKKNTIDKMYEFEEPKLEYSIEENERKQNYIKGIRRLNNYSKNPNFNNVVNFFGLNNYL